MIEANTCVTFGLMVPGMSIFFKRETQVAVKFQFQFYTKNSPKKRYFKKKINPTWLDFEISILPK